jgi:RHS repeat-associated protein
MTMMKRTGDKTFVNMRRYDQLSKKRFGKLLGNIFLASIFLFGFSIFGYGQDQSNIRNTQGSVNDSGQLDLGIELGNYPGPGLNIPVSLSYSSNVWSIDHINTVHFNGYTQSVTKAVYSKNSFAGWKSSLSLPIIEFTKFSDGYDYKGKPYHIVTSANGGCFNFRLPEVFIHMPDGSTHTLRKNDWPTNSAYPDTSDTFYAIDGSRIRFDAGSTVGTGTIYTPDGTRYTINTTSASIQDKNGNTLTYDNSTREWTDALGRHIVDPLTAPSDDDEIEYSLPGLEGGSYEELNYVFKWKHLEDALTPDGNNQTPALRVVASEYLPNPSSPPTNYGSGNYPLAQSSSYGRLFQSIAPEEDPNFPGQQRMATLIVGDGQSQSQLFNPIVLTEIKLPDGSSYKFSYNVYGEIDKVIYPTTAYEKYEYAGPAAVASQGDSLEGDAQPYVQQLRHLSSKKQSINGTGNDILEWTYEGGNWMDGGGAFSTTNPDGTQVTSIKFGPGDKYADNQQRRYYRFGDKDPRVGMPFSKTFYSKPVNGVRSMLRRELYAYDAYESYETEYHVTCQLGQSPTTTNFKMRRAARLSQVTNIIFEEGNSSALTQTSKFLYDTNNYLTTGVDRTYAAVYDYYAISSSAAQTVAIGDITVPSTPLKYTETVYNTDSTYRDANILGLPAVVKVRTGPNVGDILSQSEMLYDDSGYVPANTHRGLPTTQRTWDSTKGLVTDTSAYLITHTKFDTHGNRIETTDAKQIVTTTSYDSTGTYPISVTSAAPGNTTYGSSSGFTASVSYDMMTGLVLTTTDANGQVTHFEYEDTLLRPTKVLDPNGHQSITQYGTDPANPNERWVKVKTQIDATHWNEGYSWYDGAGRAYKTQKVDAQGDIFSETEYDDMGRVKRSTNPYRTGETKRWTTPTYDDLSRTTKVTTPDPTSTPTTVQVSYGLSISGIVGTTKTITDQAGKKRKGFGNALGNMVRVVEDPDGQNLVTDYVFDKLGNLRKITQGDQSRYFRYDSLGRVLFAKQVEQDDNTAISVTGNMDPITGNYHWSTKYEYDNNSNIIKTTDAKNHYIQGTYDNINRLIYRDFSDTSMPDVTFYYDGTGLGGSAPAYSKGKTTRIASSVSESRNTSFDSIGHLLTSEQRTTPEQLAGTQSPYTFTYTYNLAGGLMDETYPSGRVVKNNLNADGELAQVQSKKNSTAGYWTYADGFTYNSAGAVTKMQLGNGHWETAVYNERNQVTQIGLGTTSTTQNLLKLEFGYTSTSTSNDNNGSMRSQIITVPTTGSAAGFTATQIYTYDSLNRLGQVTEYSSPNDWQQTFAYDRYGNRRLAEGGTTTLPKNCNGNTEVCAADRKKLNPTISTGTNRLDLDQDGDSINDYTYDVNGALTKNALGERFGYDEENRQKEFFSASNSTSTPDVTYSYDGEGKRVKKVAGNETTIFVYDTNGKLAAEYSTTIETAKPVTNYLTADHLGSPRITTDASGAVTSRKDFSAFGEEVVTAQRISGLGYTLTIEEIRQDYTGYQKDTESGLEYAQARYYNPRHGRFTSVDPLTASATIRNPQSLNRYSYALNSPYKFTDPLGLMGVATGTGYVCHAANMNCNADGAPDGLWAGGPLKGEGDAPPLSPEVITLSLNIVYDKDVMTLSAAQDIIKDNLKELQKAYGNIGIVFTVTYTAGSANSARTRIDDKSAKEGAINVFLFSANGKAEVNGSYYDGGSRQIFMSYIGGGYWAKGRGLIHEMGHLLRHFAQGNPASGIPFPTKTSSGWVWGDSANQTEDMIIDSTNSYLINGDVNYGTDWVDDYRNVSTTTYTLLNAWGVAHAGQEPKFKTTSQQRTPTVLDIYRLGARMIATQ